MTRSSHRPTLAPPFDVAEYARESDRVEREQQQAADGATENPDRARSQVRLITQPQWGQFVTNDAWSRMMVGAPTVTMTAECLKRLPLDHRAGFVLSLMDGSLDLETLLELSGMDRDEALTLVRNLFHSGVVDFR